MEESREELEKKYGISLSPGAIRKRTIRDTALILLAGVAYYICVTCTPFALQCYFYVITGLKCPACGATHMVIAASHFDFVRAFGYNQFLFVTFPYVAGEIIYLIYINEAKKHINRINQIVLFIWLGLFIIFGIIRNLFF